MSLKARKEEFVTGLTGSTIEEIYLITSVSLLTYFLYCLTNTLTNIFTNKDKSQNVNIFTITLDFCLNWVSLLLSITTYSSNIVRLSYSVALPFCVLVATNWTYKYKKAPSTKAKTKAKAKTSTTTKDAQLDKKTLLPKRAFLTVYRSQMIVITAIAILAVDFNVFPRRYAKCETWGTSLMDLGVGSFVFSMGVVSARNTIWTTYNEEQLSFKQRLVLVFKKTLKSFKDSFTVFCLGIGRLFLVKFVNYQEHVSEYGVHWNFFVTLALLSPIKYCLEFLCSIFHLRLYNVFVGVAISVGYEYLLQADNSALLKYLISDSRVSIVDKNKEGLSSLTGYMAIFLIGEAVGSFLLPGVATPYNLIRNSTKTEISQRPSKLSKLFTFSASTCLLVYTLVFDVITYFVLTDPRAPVTPNVSRRFANFPYVLFVVCYNLNFLCGFRLVHAFFEYLWKNSDRDWDTYINVPFGLESVNNNGLLVFLVSNLLTGCVNLTFNTLDATQWESIAILMGYMACVNLIAIVLNYKKIYIKI